jgi:hypothetical protein
VVIASRLLELTVTLVANRTLRFVDSCPKGLKIDISFKPPAYIPGRNSVRVVSTVCLLSDSVVIRRVGVTGL